MTNELAAMLTSAADLCGELAALHARAAASFGELEERLNLMVEPPGEPVDILAERTDLGEQ